MKNYPMPLLPSDISSIRGRCYPPDGYFEPFEASDLDRSIAARFGEYANENPSHLAVKTRYAKASYQQLDLSSNRVANALDSISTTRGAGVAIWLRNGVKAVSAILGTFKAGDYIVPLDPFLPEERIRHILKDSRSAVLITESALMPTAEGLVHEDMQILLYEEVQATAASTRIDLSSSTADLSYLLYTSGSTGRPKGVIHTQRNLLHTVMNYTNALRIGRADRLSMFFSLSFSSGIIDTFCALLNGAAILAWDIRTDGFGELDAWILDERISLLNWSPTPFRHFIASTCPNLADSDVRLLVLGGETVTPEDFDLYHEYFPAVCLFVNRLGTTETNNFRLNFFDHNSEPEGSPLPVGYEVPDKLVRILGPDGRDLGSGVLGEIAVESPFLAEGYWEDPQLTQEKFHDVDGNGQRIFLTGDLGILGNDNLLEIRGRKDWQVRIRGYRVELDEIQNAMTNIGPIREAVVTAQDDEMGTTILVGFYRTSDAIDIDSHEIREQLRRELPSYMIPDRYIGIDSWPLSSTGKLDRAQLRELASHQAERDETIRGPQSAAQASLHALLSEALGRKRLSIEKNLFTYGLNSLHIAQVASRIRDELGVSIPFADFFEYPTVRDLSARLGALRDVIDRVPDEDQPMAPKRAIDGVPASFGQQRLWLLQNLSPDSPIYNIPSRFRLRGSLNPDAIVYGINEIVRRHEPLRTTYSMHDGKLRQTTMANCTIPLEIIDLTPLSESERESRISSYSRIEAEQQFDLANGPLLRGKLLKLAEDDHILLLTIHHIATDGWSMQIFFKELGERYQEYSSDQRSSWPYLTATYSDYVAWERKRLRQGYFDDQISYWSRRLDSAPTTIDLPLDRFGKHTHARQGQQFSVDLNPSILEGVQELSRAENATEFITLLTAYISMINRISGQDDFIIGTPIANRIHPDLENLIGFFLNTLPFRAQVSGDPTFRELLNIVRRRWIEALQNREAPFELLVEGLQAARGGNQAPLIQIWFNVQNFPQQPLDIPGLQIQRLLLDTGTAMFALSLTVIESSQGRTLRFGYDSSIFERSTVDQFAIYYVAVLNNAISNPDARLSSVRLSNQAYPHQIGLRNSSPPEATPVSLFPEVDIHQTIPGRFSRIVEEYPDRKAIQWNRESFSYAELDHLSSGVNDRIREIEESDGGQVALLFSHGSPMFVAMLGAMKSGKSYVPLDTSHPRTRMAEIVSDSHATIILTDSSSHELARQLITAKDHVIDVEKTIGRPTKSSGMAENFDPDRLAYLLYTSGSTGRPKGVMQTHHNVLFHIMNYSNNLLIRPDDRILMLASYAFDASVMDIYGALLNGATLLPFDVKGNGFRQLSEFIHRNRITIYHSTPTLYRYFMRSLKREEIFTSVRAVVLGGEAVFGPDLDLFRKHFAQGAVFVNGYGPTESTLALQYFADHSSPSFSSALPVGTPVPGTSVQLVNANRKRAGVQGEIAITSPHVAAGYWKESELTKKKFIEDSESGPDRTYLTGDIARLLLDGNLEFRGRKDRQIKIRGFRVELGEIESILEQNEAIQSAVVTMADHDADDQHILAYIVEESGSILSDSDVVRYLRARIPDYMTPRQFIRIDRVPLTSTGKIDRLALPEPEIARPQPGSESPQDWVEVYLQHAWKQILNRSSVGMKDNFFAIGGHSLTAVRLLARIRESFGVQLPLAALHSAPTIEQLASLIRDEGGPIDMSPLIPLRVEGEREGIFIVPGNLGNVFTDLSSLSQYLDPTHSVYGLQDGIELPTRIEPLASTYVDEILGAGHRGPYILGGICSGALIALEMANQLSAMGHAISFLALIEPVKLWRPRLRTYIQWLRYMLRRTGRRLGRGLGSESSLKLSLDRNFIRMKLKVLGNSLAVRRYQPSPYRGPVHMYMTGESRGSQTKPGQLNWPDVLKGRLYLHEIPGSHDSITGNNNTAISEENMKVLAELINTHIGCLPNGF